MAKKMKVRRHMAAKTDKPEDKKAKAVSVLRVKAGMKYRGAREAWYARLVEHDGKEPEVFLKSAKDRPPSLTKAGTAENPKGWLSYFQRNGVVAVEEGKGGKAGGGEKAAA